MRKVQRDMGTGSLRQRDGNATHRKVLARAPSSGSARPAAGASVADFSKPMRVPVDFRYDALNPEFLKCLAMIGAYADQKYGAWEQYTGARLTGDKSPINHIYEHLRAYVMGESYDHFDGDMRWQLVAVAYNAMMAYYNHSRWGHERHPLTVEPSCGHGLGAPGAVSRNSAWAEKT